MTISEKQLAANRRNAQRSAGPRTAAGKQIVARNAISHGIFARDVVTSRAERAEDFESLRDALMDDLHPQGALEELLVGEIATLYWRRRRVLQAEAGAIDGSLADATTGGSSHDLSSEIIQKLRIVESLDGSESVYGAPVARAIRDRIQTSAEGQAILLARLRAALASLDDEEPFPTPVRRRLTDILEPQSELTRLIKELDSTPPADLPTALVHIRGALDRRIGRAEDHYAVLDARRAEEQARLTARHALPSGPQADTILRYDKTVGNALARALTELHRLQNSRRGSGAAGDLLS